MRLAAALPVLVAATTVHAASLSPLTDDAASLVLTPRAPDAIAADHPQDVTLSARQPGFHPLVQGGPLPEATIPGLLLARQAPVAARTGPPLPER